MGTNETADAESTQQVKQELFDGKQKLSTQLADHLDGTTVAVSELSECIIKAREFMQKELVENTKEALDERMQRPITKAFSDMKNVLSDVSNKVEEGINKLTSDANEESEMVDKLEGEVVAPGTKELSDKLASQQQEVSDFNRQLVSLSRSNEGAADTAMQETEQNIESCGRSTKDYTTNVIAMDAETEPVPPAKEFVYSEDFSSTAPPETIIAQLWASKAEVCQ